MRYLILHEPSGCMMDRPYVVAQVDAAMLDSEARQIFVDEWKKFQATKPDTDDLFGDWLIKHDKRFSIVKDQARQSVMYIS